MKNVGIIVKLSRLPTPALPTTVINPSAKALASVPASVERRPQLKTPRDNREDITFERSDMFTPAPHTKMRDIIDIQTVPVGLILRQESVV